MRTAFVPQALTSDESSFKGRILVSYAESKDDDRGKIHAAICEAEVDFVLQLTTKDSFVDAICRQPRFDPHWQNVWRAMGLNPSEFSVENKDSLHENLPLTTVSCLDLLKGDYVYRKYRSLIDEAEEMTPETYKMAKAYLEESAGYGCYFALNALCTNGLKQLKDMDVSADRQLVAQKILMYAQKAAELHFTPGYLLLSNVLQELHLYSADIYPDAPKSMQKKSFFVDAAVALSMAQKLEEHSSPMINNAYQGKTIWQASGGLINSWLQTKVYLQGMSGGLLTLGDMDKAAKQADSNIIDMDKRHAFDKLAPTTIEKMAVCENSDLSFRMSH